MKNKTIFTLGILAIVAIILTACGSQNMEELLVGKSWQLLSMGAEASPEAILPDSEINLEFDFESNKIAGVAGCNNYFAGFELNEDEMSTSVPGSTMMYCEPEELMAQEAAFLVAIEQAHHLSIENGQLIIQYGEGQVLIFE